MKMYTSRWKTHSGNIGNHEADNGTSPSVKLACLTRKAEEAVAVTYGTTAVDIERV